MNSIMQTLKMQTWPCHLRLDQQLDLLNPDFTALNYQGLLRTLLGYYRPMERHLQLRTELRTWIPDLDLRAKSHLLEADLLALGDSAETISKISLCKDLPAIDTLASALGCLYVLEGATLGGQVISRHLLQSLGIGSNNGGAFFEGYGQATATMWKRFGEHTVAAVTGLELRESSVVASACATFESLERWVVHSGDHRG
jgi:heme oxygenase